MGSRLKLEPSYGFVVGLGCDNRYGFCFLCVSQHCLKLLCRGLEALGAREMAGLEPIEVIAHFQIGHAHHPLHQVLPVGIKPFASLQRFDQQIEQELWRL